MLVKEIINIIREDGGIKLFLLRGAAFTGTAYLMCRAVSAVMGALLL